MYGAGRAPHAPTPPRPAPAPGSASENRQQPPDGPTTLGAMTGYTPLPVPAAALRELRAADDAGQPLQPYTAREDGVPLACVGSPLRCCLRGIEPGERVALVSYAPLRRWAAQTGARPGAYDETGPVFIHADPCAGPSVPAGTFRSAGRERCAPSAATTPGGHIVRGPPLS
ncbi:conserved hypothetical protein, partial [Streptomyces sp. e14]